MAEKSLDDLNKLVSLCKRRGFVFQSSEIYGGVNSCWDYGPLGVELKRNLKDLWWHSMVLREDIEGLDASILMHPKVWEASGHVDSFTDPLVDCKRCKQRYRQDTLETENCPACKGELTEPRMFNLMFKTFMGPVEGDTSVVYLRPETAQGIFVNFINVQTSARKRIPFGIAQIGKAFRNEITPGNFIFRTREFEQMEMQFFVKPDADEEWFKYWMQERMKWYGDAGIRTEKLRFHEHGPDALAHYAKAAYDIEYEFPGSLGWNEIEGIHNRTDFDLAKHQEFSGKKMEYFDDQAKERYLPFIIETSAGCDRNILTFLVDAYREEEDQKGETRVVMRFSPKLAPIKIAVLPLSKKPPLQELGRKIQGVLQTKYRTVYDETGSIGKRYRRQDEIGTPLCLTIDFDSLEDGQVTVRHRDTMEQNRVGIDNLSVFIEGELLNFKVGS